MLYKEDLDSQKCPCGDPACEDPVFLHASCHIQNAPWVRYFNGCLVLICSVCDTVVCEVAVKERRP